MLDYSPMTIVKHGNGFKVSERSCQIGSADTREACQAIIAKRKEERKLFELYFCQLPPVRA